MSVCVCSCFCFLFCRYPLNPLPPEQLLHIDGSSQQACTALCSSSLVSQLAVGLPGYPAVEPVSSPHALRYRHITPFTNSSQHLCIVLIFCFLLALHKTKQPHTCRVTQSHIYSLTLARSHAIGVFPRLTRTKGGNAITITSQASGKPMPAVIFAQHGWCLNNWHLARKILACSLSLTHTHTHCLLEANTFLLPVWSHWNAFVVVCLLLLALCVCVWK